jgi:hypothetical protein
MAQAGADRIGASASVAIVTGASEPADGKAGAKAKAKAKGY